MKKILLAIIFAAPCTIHAQVGIGTINPYTNLHVIDSSGSKTEVRIQSMALESSSQLTFTNENVVGDFFRIGKFKDGTPGSYAGVTLSNTCMVLANFDAGRLMMGTQGNYPLHLIAGNARRAIITQDGNMGIGTDTAEFRLTVGDDGGILAKGTYGTGTVLTTSGPAEG